MAIFDRNEDRIVVRVVYDGLGNAGKSTNLRQLCGLFTLHRRSELFVPEERSGRTLYFDWIQIESGLVGGYRLRCQAISVPGQFVLRERRARLLKSADVIVLVCDSTPAGVDRVRRGLARTRTFLAQHGRADVPFVVQANKQDLPGALAPEEVRRELGFGPETQVVPARAMESVGVRETIVLALRAAADRVQHQLLQHGIQALHGEVESADALYAEMRKDETYDEETVALAALLDDSLHGAAPSGVVATQSEPGALPPAVVEVVAAPAAVVEVAPAPVVAPVAPVEVASVSSATPAAVVEMAFAEKPQAPAPDSASATQPAAPPAPSLPVPDGRSAAESHAFNAPSSAPTEQTVSPVPAARSNVEAESPPVPQGWPRPPLQPKQVPSGLAWPTVGARDILRGLEGATPLPVEGRVAQAGGDGSGKSGLVLYRLGDSCCKTHLGRVWDDADQARSALLALVRVKQSLGARVPKGTVLAVTEEAGRYWLWTVTPWLDTLQARISSAAEQRNDGALAAALLDFAEAAADALCTFARGGPLLDLHPSNFARLDDTVVYLDDELGRDGSAYPLLHALLHRVEQYNEFPGALASYTLRVGEALRALSGDELRRIQAMPHLRELSPRTVVGRHAVEHWINAVRSVLLASALSAPANAGSADPHSDPFRRSPSFAPARPVGAAEAATRRDDQPTGEQKPFPDDSVTRDYQVVALAAPRAPVRAPQPLSNPAPEAAPSSQAAPIAPAPAASPTAPSAVSPPARAPSERPAAAVAPEQPPLPHDADSLPSGYIWPATKGRELIRRLGTLAGQLAPVAELPMCYRAGDYTLRTSPEQRFLDAEEARAALLSRARALVPTLGRDPTGFVLVLVPSNVNPSHWLWTIEAAAS